MLTGPTALATSIDPVAAAKVAVEFAKTNDRLEIVGGAMGDTLLDVNGIKALAALPSLDELRGTDRGPHPGARDQDRAHVKSRVPSWHASSGPMPPRQPSFSLNFTTHDIMGRSPRKEFKMADINKLVDQLSN
jgi:hypothetical protein